MDTGPDKIVEDAATVEVFLLSEEPTTAAMQRYLNALTDDDQKQFLVAALAAEFYRWMVTSLVVTGRPNLLLYLDEARDFLPAGTTKPPGLEGRAFRCRPLCLLHEGAWSPDRLERETWSGSGP